jgi:hypothetical protein
MVGAHFHMIFFSSAGIDVFLWRHRRGASQRCVEASSGYRCGDGFDLQLGRNRLQRRLHQAPGRLPVARCRLRCRRLQIQVGRLRARPAR